MKTRLSFVLLLVAALCLLGAALPALADGGVTFTDAAADPATGIDYNRTPSPDRMAKRAAIYSTTPFLASQFPAAIREFPLKSHGVPGIAILDHDVDGDLDIYVTNGPGAPNSLYSSQLQETGQLTYVDVAAAAGVEATSMDGSGVCFGDIDNDGDPDLYVVSTGDPFRLYENNGDGTFTDISDATVSGSGRHANGCNMGDVNNDGLLDILVANSYDDWNHRKATNAPGPNYPFMEHNFLFLNQGGNSFADVTAAAGLENVSNMDQPGHSGAALTWAIGSFDFDRDGDADVLSADNQGSPPQNQSQRRGWLRLYENDGTGAFDEITDTAGLEVDGGWMGLAFGDYNCDGNLDFFGTNVGDFLANPNARSRFYYGDGAGGFQVAGVLGGPEKGNSFGWGVSPLDYDNDGDLDVVYHGSVDRFNFIGSDNPGVLVQNQGLCSGEFDYDIKTFQVDHAPRNVQGVAVGDLNNDGFTDIVSASAFNLVPDGFYLNVSFFGATDSPLVPISFVEFVLFQFNPAIGFQLLNPNLQLNPGTLVVEINNGENGNDSVKVRTRGSVGTLAGGAVNRDGVGAIVTLTPKSGPSVTRTVIAGSSYASQDALELVFGMGSEKKADLDILWPGGVKNSLRGVKTGDDVLLPEIPCSYDTDASFQDYHACVTDALDVLIGDGVLPVNERGHFLSSAIDAYHEAH